LNKRKYYDDDVVFNQTLGYGYYSLLKNYEICSI